MADLELKKPDYFDQLSKNGLWKSSWPVEHGDNQRSKMFPGGITIDPSKPLEDQVTITESEVDVLHDPQMIYTREKDQMYVYGGKVSSRYLARLDAQTLKIEQKYSLNTAIYQGGAIIHENGNVYAINGNVLFKFKNGDLREESVEKVTLSDINGSLTCCNGLVTLENGLLVIKLFAINFYDVWALLAGFLRLRIWRPLLLISGICLLEFLLGSGFVFASLLMHLFVYLAIILISGMVLFDQFVPLEKYSWRWNKFFKVQHGLLLLVDPETMKIVSEHVLDDKCTYPRLSVAKRKDNKQHVIVLGDYFVQKFTYFYDDGSFVPDKQWEKPYRFPHDRTTRGTGPTVIGREVFFTNNTYPEALYVDNYAVWKANVDDPSVYKKFEMTPAGKQGFMWWSVVSNPIINGAILWDSLNEKLVCLDYDLNLLWTPNQLSPDGSKRDLRIRPHDCMVTSPKGGHVYLTDVDVSLPKPDILVDAYSKATFKCQKYFVVLDAKTGTEIGRVRLHSAISPRACNIAIGNNDDVLIGLVDRMIRISNKTPLVNSSLLEEPSNTKTYR